MNIEKVKNYNQHMLAILCSLGFLLLLLLIIMTIIEIFPVHRNIQPTQGLIAGKNIETLNQENLRQQIISYEPVWLVDTLNTVYIIPVSIKTLKSPEEIKRSEKDSHSLFSKTAKGKGYYYNHFKGDYANLIVYNPKSKQIKPLFNERVMVGNINIFYFKDDILLACYMTSKDTNNNGIIDLNDHRTLCIYSMYSGAMKLISDPEHQLEEFQFIENSKDLLITFSLSRYNHKQFDNYQLPKKIMKYDYQKQELTDIIPQNIQKEIQKLVEGK